MLIENNEWHTIWLNKDTQKVQVIDQTRLPHKFEVKDINSSLKLQMQ